MKRTVECGWSYPAESRETKRTRSRRVVRNFRFMSETDVDVYFRYGSFSFFFFFRFIPHSRDIAPFSGSRVTPRATLCAWVDLQRTVNVSLTAGFYRRTENNGNARERFFIISRPSPPPPNLFTQFFMRQPPIENAKAGIGFSANSLFNRFYRKNDTARKNPIL